MTRLASALFLLLLGCAATAAGEAPLPPPPADPHDLAVSAIAVGAATDEVERLLEAERRLAAAGARPMAGVSDLGAEWRAEAEAAAGHRLPSQPARGRALGSAYKHAVLGQGQVLAIEQIFLAGRKAKVSVVASGASRLRFNISDHEGEALCTKTVAGQPQSCAWLPTWTSRYRIELRNQGGGEARVYLVVN